MSNLFWLTDAQMARLEPFFPKSHGKPRVDDRRVLNGIFWVLRSGSPWADLPGRYGPPTTIYNRFNRWARAGVWVQVFETLSARSQGARPFLVGRRRNPRQEP